MDPMCDFDTDDDHTVYRVEVITKEYQTLPSIDYHPGWNFSVNSFFLFHCAIVHVLWYDCRIT